MDTVKHILNGGSSDLKRENGNIDASTAMGSMLKIGSETTKEFHLIHSMPALYATLHRAGDIHIHDLDFYSFTTTCCQIDLIKLFKDGFFTGHGECREPNSITSYAALACIAIQSNQNDQHGGQSIPNFDYAMAEGVNKSYKKIFIDVFARVASLNGQVRVNNGRVFDVELKPYEDMRSEIKAADLDLVLGENVSIEIESDLNYAEIYAVHKDWITEQVMLELENLTYQAMEALIHNLNTMNSRAGSQVPFSSLNYGTDTSPAGRMVIKNLLLATEAGLGRGETPIFPIQVFKVKEGTNYNEGDPNYDLFMMACRVSSKRLFPNFAFLDAPFNLKFYKSGDVSTEVAYMGCRTRVLDNVYDPTQKVVYGRGNLSFTSINLPRIALKYKDRTEFFIQLDRMMGWVKEQLLQRLELQMQRVGRNFPFLMGQNIWRDSEGVEADQPLGDVLKHGTLGIGFIGLAETLILLTGQHQGESGDSQALGLEIVRFMRAYTDRVAAELGLNFSLIATPAEGLAGRFIKLDKEKYGEIAGVTDKDYYTNSFHVPVYFPISIHQKIAVEAPYHELTNGGHISYVELDGDPSKNLPAYVKIIRYMKEQGIGYGSINFPVDFDSVCGYQGIIYDTCPKCGRAEGDTKFQRIRRITGYLVGTLERFNNAKQQEEKHRLKHR